MITNDLLTDLFRFINYIDISSIPKKISTYYNVTYYVIEDSGFIILDGKDHDIRQGTSIFVPVKADHRFHGNKQDLVIFYALGHRS